MRCSEAMEHPRAVNLDGPNAYTEPVRNLLVRLAREEAVKHLPLARGEVRNLAPRVGNLSVTSRRTSILPPFERGKQPPGEFGLEKRESFADPFTRFRLGLEGSAHFLKFARS